MSDEQKRPQFSHFSQSKISMSRSLSKGLVAAELKMQTLHDIAAEFKEVVIQKSDLFCRRFYYTYTTLHGTTGSKPFCAQSFKIVLSILPYWKTLMKKSQFKRIQRRDFELALNPLCMSDATIKNARIPSTRLQTN